MVPTPPSAPPLLRVRGLCRQLPSGSRTLTILDGIDLEVEHGEVVAVLGPSGSGKSTLLALVAGLDRPTSGEVWLAGQPVHSLSEDELALLRRRSVGFVFQSFQLLQHLTALENVLVPLELRGVPGERSPCRRAPRRGRPGRTHPSLPGAALGRRAAAGRGGARVRRGPPLLLADEPTGNLDSATGQKVLDLLLGLQRRAGTTLFLVTHDPSVAARATRRIHLRDGRIEREERSAVSAGSATALDRAVADPMIGSIRR